MKQMYRALLAGLLVIALALSTLPAQYRATAAVAVFINEIHYDNTGGDAGEAIEIAGPAGTDLTGWSIVLYNGAVGNYLSYSTTPLSGLIPDQQNGFGTVAITYPVNGIQNGSPDGMALVAAGGVVIQFLSYEGAFTAADGPAVGILSTDIGVSEPGTDPAGLSLQLTGTGTFYEDFSWVAPSPNTINAPNTGQIFTGGAEPTPLINEFSANTTGTDVEYVEIFGEPGTDFSAYTLLEVEGDAPSIGLVDEVIAIGTTDANGFYLASLAANTLENGSVSLLLVSNFSGTLGLDLDVDDDGFLDDGNPLWDELIDSVAILDGGTGDAAYGVPALASGFDGLTNTPGGASRIPDGTDTDLSTDWMRNDFDLAGIPGFSGTISVGEAYNTPGASNLAYTPPPEACGDPFTGIYDVQGSGETSPLVGTQVAVEGVVVGDFQNNTSPDNGEFNGFHLQDAAGDDDPLTSDGVFIYAAGSTDVAIGDTVRVRGSISEYNGLTEITSSQIWICGSGSVITPTQVMLPVTALSDFEAYEGMLVTFPQALTISEYFNYDRYGEMVLALPLDGEPRAFTPTAVEEPGPDAIARAQANLLRRITLDDGLSAQNPPSVRHPNGLPFSLENTFRGGDTVANLTGVLDYSFNLYRIQPTGAADYTAANPRPAAPETVVGEVHVAAMNTLNFFLTLDYPSGNPLDNKCGPLQNVECRGADSDQPDEFTRQRTKLLAALAGLDADIIGLNELENTAGVDPLGDPSLGVVAGLNAFFGDGTYAAIDTGVIGTDAIRVGMIYRPAVVTPVGSFQVLDSSDDPRFLDTKNRPALAQTFEVISSGERFTIVVNHLKSKGSDCNDVGDPDMGDGQGNCNQTRLAAAQALVDWLAADPTGSGDPDFLIMGDLNSYAMEDPIDAILAGPDDTLGTADDYTNLIRQFQGQFAYSYVFDGQTGYLDQALASASMLSQVTGAADWHINADEVDLIDYETSFKPAEQDALYEPNAYRSSDHDPVIVGLSFNAAAEVDPIAVKPTVVKVNRAISASAAFEDPGDDDPHTGVWDWGDGTTSPAVISESGGNGTATGTHAYTSSGFYTVKLVVTDSRGAAKEVVYESVVVYDPAEGYFTGNGWYLSPAGAYLPNPGLQGNAVFRFNVRYHPGLRVPTGYLTVRIRTGNFSFQSTRFDWMVVDDDQAIIQGVGRIGGQGVYKFKIYVTDGSPDTFRMIIWYEDAGGQHIVYDNGAEQAIGGGSIIHRP